MTGAQAGVLERGEAFVRAHGDALARARAAAARDPASADAALDLLAEAQAADGAFRVAAPDAGAGSEAGGVAGTLRALEILGEISRLGADVLAPAARFLEAAQVSDGSWTAAREPAAGDGERVLTTGRLAGHLARTVSVRPRVLDAACAYLEAHFDRDALEAAGPAQIEAWTCFLANAATDLADAGLQWAGRAFERALREGRLDPVSAARLLVRADAHALPGARTDASALVPLLLAAQAPDGGFGPPGGPPAARVEATVVALVALGRFGLGASG